LPAERGVRVLSVRPGGAADAAGLRAGDLLLGIDDNRISDSIDYLFHCEGPEPELAISRGGRRKRLRMYLAEGEDPGVELEHFRVKTCRNKCVFCFVSQLPRGLRKPLYLKDEDYRMSFLYGNYITLTNLSDDDRRRIVTQRLSPLYISVHATDRELRNLMLGNPRAPDVMEELRFFGKHGISVHTQVVLCPGYNDGPALVRTIRDLGSLYPSVASVAVVPVGLTAHRHKELRPVEKGDAARALRVVESAQRDFLSIHGGPLVYAADELYIKADEAFPPLKHYGDLPQIENGVGMVPLFRHEARRVRPEAPKVKRKFLTFTGESFYPYLRRFLRKLRAAGIHIMAVPVENTFFGSSVTVAGLLTGRDVAAALRPAAEDRDVLLVPDVVLREGGDVFLDDMTVSDLRASLGLPCRIIESTPRGLMDGIR
jgi:putative radical SAM enzyme (TIGR03279 family)